MLQQLGTVQQIKNAQAQNLLTQQDIQLRGVQTNQAQTNLNTQRMNRQAQIAYGLSNLPDAQLAGGAPVRAAIDAELAAGTIDQNTHDVFLKNLPPATDQNGNPTPAPVWRQAINSHLIGTLAGPDAIKAVTGQPYVMNNGQTLQPGMIAGPLSGQPGAFNPAGPSTTILPSPESQNTPETVWDPNANGGVGGFVYQPRGSLPGFGGRGGAGGGANTPASSGGGTTNQPTSPQNGPPRLNPPPSQPQPQQQPQPAQPQPPQPAQPQPRQAAAAQPPPGSTDEFATSAKQYAADNLAGGSFTQRVFPLYQADSLLKNTTTGGGTETVNSVRNFLLAQAPWLESVGLGRDKVQAANYDELQKYLQQYVNGQPFASGSDQRLASALTGNPSTHINNLAAQNVVKAAIGLERMKQAGLEEFNATHPPGSGAQYSRWLTNWSSNIDPRAFIVDKLSPDQRTAMFKSMTPQERTQFAKSYSIARKYPDLMTSQAMPPPVQAGQ